MWTSSSPGREGRDGESGWPKNQHDRADVLTLGCQGKGVETFENGARS